MVHTEAHRIQIDTRSQSRGMFGPSHALRFTPSRKKGRREDRAPAGTHTTPMRNDCTRNAQGKHRAAKRPAFPAQGKIKMHMDLQRSAWTL
jgi:hypothetical protein